MRKHVEPYVARWSSVEDLGYPMPMRSTYDPEWRATLRDCKFPTAVVVLDFESYFDDEISMRGNKLSTIEYVTHPESEVLGCSVLNMNQPFIDYKKATCWYNGESGVEEMIKLLKLLYGEELEKCTVVCQNARFDLAVLAFKYNLRPRYVVDTLGLARHWNARAKNDLDSLAKRFGLPEKGDTQEFKGWTNRRRFKRARGRKKGPKLPQRVPVMTPEQRTQLAEYANNDVMREWELFTILLPLLSCPEVELRVMQHTLELFTKPRLKVDYARAEELKQKMDAEIDRAVDQVNIHARTRASIWEASAITNSLPSGATSSLTQPGTKWVTREDISGENSFEALLKDALFAAGCDLVEYVKPTKKKGKTWMFALAKDDPGREKLEQHPDERVRLLMAARIAVKSWPLHIKRVDRIVGQAKAAGGYLPVPLKYCGAHTGRWSGGERINLQNLGSRGHELVNAVRELLVAPEGKELVIADASQIEARVLAWLAGQWDLVEKFAKGEEIYCGFAEKVLGYPVRKPKPEGGIPAIEKRMKWARNSVGKIGVLGCGYGMGPAKAVGYAKGAIDFETAKKLVKTYRESNAKIVKFWYDIEQAFTYTHRYGKSCELRGLRFHQTDKCDVIITLPSGRELKYHTVRLDGDGYDQSLQVYNDMDRSWVHVWGGYLTENVVQAISRDILWHAIARLEGDNYDVALHVHDELIAAVDEGTGRSVLKRAVKYLSENPEWARDLPLAAEGVVSTRYGGH
jgi:DNA polymerase